jgi:hypothetical protein
MPLIDPTETFRLDPVSGRYWGHTANCQLATRSFASLRSSGACDQRGQCSFNTFSALTRAGSPPRCFAMHAIRPKELPDPFEAYGVKATIDPEEVAMEKWRDIANSDPTLPPGTLPFKEWFNQFIKSKIPDIVERAGERSGPRYEWLGDDGQVYQSDLRSNKK